MERYLRRVKCKIHEYLILFFSVGGGYYHDNHFLTDILKRGMIIQIKISLQLTCTKNMYYTLSFAKNQLKWVILVKNSMVHPKIQVYWYTKSIN